MDDQAPSRMPWIAIAAGAIALSGAAVGVYVWATPPAPPPAAAVPPAVVAAVPDRENAYRRYVAAANVIKPLLAPEGQSWGRYLRLHFFDAALPAALKQFVTDNRPALAALGEARRLGGFQSVPPQEDWGGVRPIYRRFQLLGRLGTLASRRAFAEQRYAEGFEHALAVLALGRRGIQSPGEPLHAGTVGSAILRRQLQAFGRDAHVLEQAPLPVLGAFLAELNALDRQARPVDEWLVRERDAFLAQLGTEELPLDQQAEVRVKAQAALDHQIALLRARDVRGRELDTRRYQDPGAHLAPRLALHAREMAAYIPLSGLLPSLGRAEWRLWIAEAEFDAWRVKVAATIYRRTRGKTPDSLQALVPAYLPALPPDPFRAGATLRFERGRLWSVGWDGQDQQGARPIPFDRPGYRFRPLEQDGDLVLLTLRP